MENTYVLYFPGKVQEAISELVQKYQISFDLIDDFWDFSKEDPELAIFNVAQRILKKEGSFKDVIEVLKKELKMNQKEADALAHDIKNPIVVLAEVIEQPEVENEQPSAFAKAVQERTEANAAKSNTPPRADEKKIETQNVEENAEKLKKARTVIEPQTQTRGPDDYRETIE